MSSTPPVPPPAPPPAFGGAGSSPATGGTGGRNRTGPLLALAGLALVIIGTFLPIVQFDFGDAAGVIPGAESSLNGWSSTINDGPIHLVFSVLPLVAALLVLQRGGQTWTKVSMIVSAVIGFFWVAVRHADISGSLEDNAAISGLVADISSPGIGLHLITLGWSLVLVAGLVITSRRTTSAAPTAF